MAARAGVGRDALPPSVREWYAIDGSIAVLAAYSNQDQPVLMEHLGDDYP
jgi:hypothetical protein